MAVTYSDGVVGLAAFLPESSSRDRGIGDAHHIDPVRRALGLSMELLRYPPGVMLHHACRAAEDGLSGAVIHRETHLDA